MKLYDISRTLTNDIAPWPGDTPFRFQLNGRIDEGASVNVGSISMSLHNGSHADARFHFETDGWKIDEADLLTYLGPAIVVDLSARFSGMENDKPMPQMRIEDFESVGGDLRNAPRLLVRTGVFPDSTNFPARIPVLAPGAAAWMQERGVRLLGLDIPSVDELDSRELPNHHALGAAGISILESLDLSAVAAGRYQLVALPLKIAGGDGSPVRAILWRD